MVGVHLEVSPPSILLLIYRQPVRTIKKKNDIETWAVFLHESARRQSCIGLCSRSVYIFFIKEEQGRVLLASKKMRTCTCLQQVGKLVGARECGAANTALTRLSSRQRLALTLAYQEPPVSALPSFSGRISGADAPIVRPASLHQRAMQSPRALRGLHVARARRSSALRELAEQQQERREVAEEAQTETGIAATLCSVLECPGSAWL